MIFIPVAAGMIITVSLADRSLNSNLANSPFDI